MVQIEQAITTPLEDFNFVVKTLYKTTVVSLQEVVGDFVQVGVQSGQEGVKTGQQTGLDLFAPSLDRLGGFSFSQILLENGGQGFAQVIS